MNDRGETSRRGRTEGERLGPGGLGTIDGMEGRRGTLTATKRATVAGVAAVLLVVAGCGGSSSHVGISTPTTSPPVTSPTTGGGLADCATILKTYLSLASTAVKGQDAAASAQKTLNGIKSELPASLQNDLSVVAKAFGTIAAQGVANGLKALTTDEFKTANENILRYLRNNCLPGS